MAALHPSHGPHRPPASSGRPAWPHFDAFPYMRWFDPISWTCWHLVVDFHRRELGIVLPRYGLDLFPDVDVRLEFAAAKASGEWTEVIPPVKHPGHFNRIVNTIIASQAVRFGDVVTFRDGAQDDGHAGVVVEPMTMLHVRRGTYSQITRYDSRAWAPRLSGIFRWTR